MFKPKKLAKYCKDCGKIIYIKITPTKYNSETGKVIKIKYVAHCWNTSYADEGTNRHYYKQWYTNNAENISFGDPNCN
ncbi:hypothetical protein LCGC14_1779380 [marine sediment metagenome]|uniref:Uncharacterized protein n=1 Tax=marine sediment metagenome TaxID=412755 RepID=A0A0F9GVT4_9ZZZZ